MKRCSRCKEEKLLVDFAPSKNRKDGVYPQCRPCHAAALRESYFRCKEARLKYGKEYVKRNRERVKAKVKARYWATREDQIAKAKQWFRNNRQRRKAYITGWNNANRDKVRAYQKRHKARKRDAVVSDLTSRGWELVRATFREKCAYCGARVKLEQDHVQPVSKGGWHSNSNIVPACRSCNASKADRPAPAFWWAV